ncbi:ribonuclease R [Lactiplantibacillus plantarum]|uniref:ribonuclease R n=1 Tax=Lactiplantibacillus plantarum TaxID=1590 RepID=UPI000A17CF65|nr:ribonuclease R [Lactiplantibacillus plantarum]ARK33499.1 ribonuclease R [Lactiplantibacillus plantarum]QAR76798.1 ribonuclease R [Lactiplantibacillus plantarum]QBA78090.1 ribonuclease R [Lactiplantibacillus plantarum]RWZ47244.1 ribonuclease R [Lactiplantibacillus plantarum]RWZ71409.1 ribonuclease R [Lactiplantibacillus plantarum]
MSEANLQEQILTFLQAHPDRTYSVEQLTDELHFTGATAFTFLVKELANMERKKLVSTDDHDHFKLVQETKTVEGSFHGNDKGFGFVRYDPDLPDIYINPDNTQFAITGDDVAVEIIRPARPGSDRGPEGKIVSIVKRNYTQIVGAYTPSTDEDGIIGSVEIKDKKLSKYQLLITDQGLHPTEGEVIIAEVAAYPDAQHPTRMIGIAKQVIGSVDDPGMDVLQVVYQHDVPSVFPEEVTDEANRIPDYVTDEEKVGRVDITDQPLVTIDGAESKDLDDAVVAWRLPNGNFHLGVHIADVSHYVTENSELDREAFKRGTSVYLTDRVIPMLPRRLSNGICSLNPDVERLAMSCEMEIDQTGEIVNHKIFQSVIRSHARMTYDAVNQILEAHDPKTREKYADLVDMFDTMGDLHRILYKHRRHRGAIDFDDNEAKIIVDEAGHPIDIQLRVRGLAERMIESFMLAANETVAKNYSQLKVPFIYRVHETPDSDRMLSFFEFVTNFGVSVKGSSKDVKPKMLQDVLKKVAGKPEEAMVSVMMLRSMKQARYADQSLGHFGLAAPYYTHFTSPIRRYPDMMVHRLIRHYAENGTGEEARARYRDNLPNIAETTSDHERRGIDTERDVDSMKKAEYMADHVGETFEAVVDSVMKFGLFVELENTVEGLVHISTMDDDYYEYVEKQLALVGRKTKRTFRIGQPVKVQLMRVDKDQREVDFKLLNPEEAPKTDLLPKREHHDNYRGNNRRGGNNGNYRRNGNNNNRNNDHRGGNNNNHRNGNSNGRRNNNNHNSNNNNHSTNNNRRSSIDRRR